MSFSKTSVFNNPNPGPIINNKSGKLMVQAKWKGKVIAESPETVILEGNHYFPPQSVHMEYLQPCSKSTTCPWKGKCNYFDVQVDGEVNQEAAWIYKDPKPEAKMIKGMIAFWKGVQVG